MKTKKANAATKCGVVSATGCSPLKSWTAKDALTAAGIEKDGALWTITGVSWDGTVSVMRTEKIRPDNHEGWILYTANPGIDARPAEQQTKEAR